MFGSEIPQSHPSGMKVFINSIPAGTLSAETWDRLRTKARRNKFLMLKQVGVYLNGVLDIAFSCIGTGLKLLGALFVYMLMTAPELINTLIAEGFATKVQFILSIFVLSTIFVFICTVIFSKRLHRDPVEEEMWRLVRVILGVPATGTYFVMPAVVEIDAPNGEAAAAQ
jgi:hypothetical protein